MKSLRVLLLVICAATLAHGGDHEFRGVVRAIESTYGVHHAHIPLLGITLFFGGHAEGVSGLQLAVFENLGGAAEANDISHLLEGSLGPDWHPFVRVRSHADGETTLIYINPAGGEMRMMIFSLEQSEATVVELNVSDRAMKKWLKEPGEEAETHSGHGGHFD